MVKSVSSRRFGLVGALAMGVAGCAPMGPAAAPGAANAAEGVQPPTAHVNVSRVVYVEDDIEGATARAKAEGKALFVDVWAPWCHTCLSMKNYVLQDPSLAPLASRVLFASIDSDRESSAKFLERHQVNVWPMFFVLDPATDKVTGAWPGSASLAELRAFIEDSVAVAEASRAGSLPEGDPARMIAEARAAQAGGDPAGAAKLFERAAAKLPVDHARRSEVLAGWLFALYSAKDWAGCAKLGEAHLDDVRGAAIPADFASFLLTCAEHLPEAEQPPLRAKAIAKLRAFTASPPADASADDRADAWSTLGEALEDSGDAAGARRAYEAKIAILEKAAADAPAPEIAATFDYGRAMTYVTLGRGGYAIALLSARERDMPGSYEPPARLASVLYRLGRHADAKAAVDRAIARAYGPRKLGYVKLRGAILTKLGDKDGALEALRDEVRGWEALPAGQANPTAVADAKKRLAEAEAASRAGTTK
ncbi:MAG: thioredoxin family protein [Polyangiaceae bacterium]